MVIDPILRVVECAEAVVIAQYKRVVLNGGTAALARSSINCV